MTCYGNLIYFFLLNPYRDVRIKNRIVADKSYYFLWTRNTAPDTGVRNILTQGSIGVFAGAVGANTLLIGIWCTLNIYQ